jgi:hypothetical protein
MCPDSLEVPWPEGEPGHFCELRSRLFEADKLSKLAAHRLRKSNTFGLGYFPHLALERLGKFDAEESVTSGRIGTLHLYESIGHSQKHEMLLR